MKRQILALLVVAALMPWPLLLTRGNWWAFISVAIAIVVSLRLLFGKQWRDYAGLNLTPVEVLLAVLAFASIATGSGMLLNHVYGVTGLRADAPAAEVEFGFLFQAFNEEIFYRALLIGLLIQWLPSAPVISFGTAFVFATAHFLMYRISNPMHLALSMTALATLFFAGVAMNNLYLTFRHIGFSWAFHAGWNVVWLHASFYDAATDKQLHEPQIFDRVLGLPIVAATACAAGLLSFVLLTQRRASV